MKRLQNNEYLGLNAEPVIVGQNVNVLRNDKKGGNGNLKRPVGNERARDFISSALMLRLNAEISHRLKFNPDRINAPGG